MQRVAYAIDWKLPRHDRWSNGGGIVQSTIVHQVDPTQQAAEIAERYELHRAPILDSGHEIRVRVWPYPGDGELYAFDPDDVDLAGQWTYGPVATSRASGRR